LYPSQPGVNGALGQSIPFNIEVNSSNPGFEMYIWTVDGLTVSNNEDFTYLLSLGHIGTIHNVIVSVYDNSLSNLTNSTFWDVTVTSGQFQDYDGNDFSKIIIDGLGTAGASLMGWLDLIIILTVLSIIVVFSFKYFRKR
jgi:hypothetical protein